METAVRPYSTEVEQNSNNRVEINLNVDQSKVGSIIGKNGQNLKAIEDKTGAKIKVIGEMGQQVLRIMGSSEEASEAREKVQKISADMVLVKIKLDAKDVGRIIGQSGRNIKAMQDESGASMRVLTEGTDKVVVIRGQKANVEAAQKSVEDIISKQKQINMVISQKTVQELLKDSGRAIKNLQFETGARMNVKDDKKSENHLLQITGSEEQTRKAKQKVKELEQGKTLMENTSLNLSNLEADKLRGNAIHEIEKNTATRAFFFKKGPNRNNLVFTGNELQVDKAIHEVKQILDELAGDKLVWVPHAYVGKYKNVLKELELVVELSEEKGKGEKKFQVPLKISGSKENLKIALKKLKDIRSETDSDAAENKMELEEEKLTLKSV